MKKQSLVRTFLMAALLVGTFVVAGNDVSAQDTGAIGSGCCRGTSQSDGGGGTIGSGTLRSDGGLLGSGGGFTEDDGGGTIGSGTRSGHLGSGVGKQEEASLFSAMLKFFGF
jgi:hypothetical protein